MRYCQEGGGLIWSYSSKELQMGRILEEFTSQINTLLHVSGSVVAGWTKCQMVQRSVGATDAVARTPSLSSVVQSCSSAGRHSAVAAATQ